MLEPIGACIFNHDVNPAASPELMITQKRCNPISEILTNEVDPHVK